MVIVMVLVVVATTTTTMMTVSLVQPLYHLTGRQRQCVLNLFDSLSVHPSVNKLVKTIFWHKSSTGKVVKGSALRSVGQD